MDDNAHGLNKIKAVSTPYSVQMMYLVSRECKNQIRNPMTGVAKIAGTVFISIFFVLLFGKMQDNCSESSLNNRSGMFLMLLTVLDISTLGNIVLLFPNERVLFLKEQTTAMYSPTIYFISKIISEIPGFIIIPTIMSLIVYFLTGLNTEDASHYFIFNTYLIIFAVANTGVGFVLGASITNKDVLGKHFAL